MTRKRHASPRFAPGALPGALALAMCAALLAACQQPAPAPPAAASASTSSRPAAWDQLVAEARQEGQVNVYLGISAGAREALTGPFEKAFPGLKVNVTAGPSTDMVARLLAEREARKYIADVIVGPATQSTNTLKPAGAVAPLEPALILPEALDTSLWLENRLWWIDAAPPITTLRYQGYVGTSITYNPTVVDPREFRSFTDLLDPRWKGKIVSNDVRRPGQGGVQLRFIWRHPELGPAFLTRLFSEMDLQLSADHRQMTDWIGQGRYPIGLWISSTQVKTAAEQGLPVEEIPGDQLREGAPVSVGGGTVNLADSPPHPSAARVFVNWLLSREGQMAWQENVKQPSLRLDVPKDKLDPTGVPKPGVKYVDGGTEEFFLSVSADEITTLITRALEQSKR
jgi:iron(III) transport system substrate-binding protein